MFCIIGDERSPAEVDLGSTLESGRSSHDSESSGELFSMSNSQYVYMLRCPILAYRLRNRCRRVLIATQSTAYYDWTDSLIRQYTITDIEVESNPYLKFHLHESRSPGYGGRVR